ncbi:cell division protein FtsA [Caldisericum exile]|uniref:Cell division protein FtsA n=1 Tax=Caldisericum exile (strain DSM 21853 / NBRC 104410 / AZM16c01) TaxID=511051 RepID=A0A7U6GF72_CALEA|nr:cell division protein FtsA [Caldisericum exile]BAL81302.1 cell division protein FtsA [Caldisericum exile AZM16c01]
MDRIISALDLGSQTIKFLIGEISDGNASIIGVGTVPSKSVSKGVVIDLNKASEAVIQAKKVAETMAGKKAQNVYVSVSGTHIFSLNNKGSIIVSKEGREISRDDIKRVEESARVLLLQPNQKVIHSIPRQYIIDGQGGIRNPIGMSGIKLEEEVHIVTGSSTVLYNIEKVISMVDLKKEAFVLQSLASSLSALKEQEKELGVALVDIGAGTGDIAIFVNGSIAHTSVLPIGGEYITKDIAYALRISIEEAERIKKDFGFAQSDSVPTGETIEVSRIGSDEKITIDTSYLSDVITARVDEILQSIKLELIKSGYWGALHSGVVFTGGCAKLKNFIRRASDILEIPARLGIPRGEYTFSDILSDPEYATSIGLILYAISEGSEHAKSRNPFSGLSWLKDIFE